MAIEPTVNPVEQAMNAAPPSPERTYFGEVTVVNPRFCVLERGVGRRQFDPARDSPMQRRVAIKLAVTSLGGDVTVEQDVMDFSTVWLAYTLPSLRKHQLDVRTLKGRHVQVRCVPTHATYVTRAGETRRETALVFVHVYLDRATCRAAATAFFTREASRSRTTTSLPLCVPTLIPAAQMDVAEQALAVLWQASGEDKERFRALIATNPLLAQYFDADSPEVVDLVDPLPFSE